MNNEQMIKIKNFYYLNQNILKGKILFTGSSLMEQFPICEIARSKGFDEAIQWMKLRTSENIRMCNEHLKEIANKYECYYIDCNAGLVNENGEQKPEYAIDGVHMYANGYLNVFEIVKSYLN